MNCSVAAPRVLLAQAEQSSAQFIVTLAKVVVPSARGKQIPSESDFLPEALTK